ncbi:hypothetical protein AVEN_72191-1 [Araneus ventricosus]|uniref:Uncharacterized protein n=1 Tax=Araneus ventricosus TaxID=182803 RepID=A0A4Y2EHK4_ARAVE|nr:hypothetical protein AVEN_72191-1 [Araneus ventricosus]
MENVTLKSPVEHFPLTSGKFGPIHRDIASSLPPSAYSIDQHKVFSCILACVEWLNWWPEAIPLKEQSEQKFADFLFLGWIARFGVPEVITSGQGHNFDIIFASDETYGYA